jgi:hypothetical protein
MAFERKPDAASCSHMMQPTMIATPVNKIPHETLSVSIIRHKFYLVLLRLTISGLLRTSSKSVLVRAVYLAKYGSSCIAEDHARSFICLIECLAFARSGTECDYCLHPVDSERAAGTGDRNRLSCLGHRPDFAADRDLFSDISSRPRLWICSRRDDHHRMSRDLPDGLFRRHIRETPLVQICRSNAGRNRRRPR